MKKVYHTPTLIQHGNLEEITQVLGPSSVKDTLFFNGNPVPIDTDGSRDFSLP